MRYIKRFNETLIDDRIEVSNNIESFCRDYLSYILDENKSMSMDVDGVFGEESSYYKFNIWDKDTFYWDDIKDTFIPFLQMFIKEYSIAGVASDKPVITFTTMLEDGSQGPNYTYTLESVLNDDIISRCGSYINGIWHRVKIKHLYFYIRSK